MHTIKKIWGLFNTAQKRSFILLLTLIVFLAALQATGVGAILPIVTLLMQPDLVMSNSLAQKAFQFSGVQTVSDFTLLLLLCYGAIYITIQIGSAFLNYYQYKFVNNYQAEIAGRMLRGYLEKDYTFFLKNNSSVLLKNITQDSRGYACTFIFNALKLLTNTIIGIAISVFLIAVAPFLSMSLAAAGIVLYLLGFKKIQAKLTTWGEIRNKQLGRMNLVAHQSLSGAKEIKVHGCEEKYIREFQQEVAPFCKLNIQYHTVSSSLGHAINAVVFILVIAILATLSILGHELSKYVPLLALLGVGFSRVVPIGINITNAAISIRYHFKTFDNVLEAMELSELPASPIEPGNDQIQLSDNIQLKNCSYRYPDANSQALKNASFELKKGSKVAFVGESGAGKSTALDVLLGLIQPQAGHVFVDGVKLAKNNIRSWREKIGYVSQHTFILDSTLKQNITFDTPLKDVDVDRLNKVISMARLDKLVDRLPQGVQTSLGDKGMRISGGERQRVGIARALYRNPEILILDEPTSALDSITEKQIIDDVLALGESITIIIVTHRLTSVRFCDSLYLFENGTIKNNGDYENLLESSPAFLAMLKNFN